MAYPWCCLKPARLGHKAAEIFGRAGALPAWQGESFNSRSTARTAPQALFGYVQTDQTRCRQ